VTQLTKTGISRSLSGFIETAHKLHLPFAGMGVLLLYVLAAELGLKLAVVHGNVTAVWPPSGIALAALLLLGVRVWPAIAAGALIVNLSTAIPPLAATGIAAGNTLAGLTGLYLVQLANGQRNPVDSVRGLCALVGGGALLATAVSATVGTTVLVSSGLAPPDTFGKVWLTWWLGDATGVVVFSPLFLAWGFRSAFNINWRKWQFAEAILLSAVIVLVAQIVFGGWFTTGVYNYPLGFLPLPLMILVAFRFGVRGSSAGIVITSLLSIWGTVLGYGPFVRADLNDSLLLLQVFMEATATTTLLVAAILTERRLAQQQLQLAQQQMVTDLGQILEESLNEIYIFDAETFEFLRVNQGARNNLGYSMEELRQLKPVDIQTEFTQDSCASTLTPLLEGTVDQIYYETSHRRKDGSGYPVEVRLQLAQLGARKVYTAIIIDISDRLASQEKLLQAATVYDNLSEGILVTDTGSNITGINKAFLEITGYTEADVMSRNATTLAADGDDQNFFEVVQFIPPNSGHWQREIEFRKQQGEIVTYWINSSEVRNPDGCVTHYVSVISDISSLRNAHEQANHLAYHDPLTNLPNRFLFDDRLQQAIRNTRRQGKQMALMFLDLDRFKNINDTLGHAAGDTVLQEVAQRLVPSIREGDTVSRLGGDEFTIILEGVSEPLDVVSIADRILHELSMPFTVNERNVIISTSIGISLFAQDSGNASSLLHQADAAMYMAKGEGGNRYRFYLEEMTPLAHEQHGKISGQN
jgi:diguanylate cyclase (GGDEF)-like protein/PAS domain S-box-containing protein